MKNEDIDVLVIGAGAAGAAGADGRGRVRSGSRGGRCAHCVPAGGFEAWPLCGRARRAALGDGDRSRQMYGLQRVCYRVSVREQRALRR